MIYTSLPRKISVKERNVDVKLEKSNKISDKKSFTNIFDKVKQSNYLELEEIKASLREHLKQSKCKANKLVLEKWIIECEDMQGIKYQEEL